MPPLSLPLASSAVPAAPCSYAQAGATLGLDLLAKPELVSTDPVVAWKTALWFWMTPQAPKPSCHAVMAGG